MLVTMLSTRKGSPNGIDSVTYTQGQQYEIHGELLDVFIKEGWCEAAEPFREGEGKVKGRRAPPPIPAPPTDYRAATPPKATKPIPKERANLGSVPELLFCILDL
jgi:hypothetical protein